MTYHVETVRLDKETDTLVTKIIGEYPDKTKAMNAAKRAAHTRGDCFVYGPNSIAYRGRDLTAIVSWEAAA